MTIFENHEIDFEELGFKTMLETQNLQTTKEICRLHLAAHSDELQPAILALESQIEEAANQRQSLWTHLYDRPDPASDAWMLARGIGISLLAILFFVVFATSAAGHMTTFYLFGLGGFTSAILGLSLTGLTTAAGHLAYEKIFMRSEMLQTVMIVSALVLCFWGLFQLAEARSEMVNKLATSNATQSYVDDAVGSKNSSAPGGDDAWQ